MQVHRHVWSLYTPGLITRDRNQQTTEKWETAVDRLVLRIFFSWTQWLMENFNKLAQICQTYIQHTSSASTKQRANFQWGCELWSPWLELILSVPTSWSKQKLTLQCYPLYLIHGSYKCGITHIQVLFFPPLNPYKELNCALWQM